MSDATACASTPTTAPCPRCDLLLGLDDVQVEQVERSPTLLSVTNSSPTTGLMGCPTGGVIATGCGRKVRVLHDVPGIVPVQLLWRQRTWRCPDAGCPVGSFVKQLPGLAPACGSLTCRAVTWAMEHLRRQHGCVSGLARRLGVGGRHCGGRSSPACTPWRRTRPVRRRHLAGRR